MSKVLLGPWRTQYTVRFYSGGDTTSQAFGKHIQEIERIYGLLNALDAGKASSSEIAEAISNLIKQIEGRLKNLTIDAGQITGNIPFSRITGDIPASRVVGDLTRANIHASRVTGLKDYLRSYIEGIVREIIDSAPPAPPPPPPSPESFPVGVIVHFNSLPFTIPSGSSTKWNVSGNCTLYSDYYGKYGGWNEQFTGVNFSLDMKGGEEFTILKLVDAASVYCADKYGRNGYGRLDRDHMRKRAKEGKLNVRFERVESVDSGKVDDDGAVIYKPKFTSDPGSAKRVS